MESSQVPSSPPKAKHGDKPLRVQRGMRVVAIIQARTGSTRLPNKVLFDLAGEPMLVRVVRRVRRAKRLDQVVVATTEEPADDAIAACCTQHGWPCFRGSRDDLLDRYYQAARQYGAEVIVRITSDCPMIDPGLIDRVVEAFLARQPGVHYAANSMPHKTFPRGLDTEAIRFDALERAWHEDDNPAWREHATCYIYRHPERFNLHCVVADGDYGWMRWTVDTPEDWQFVLRVYEHFGHDRFTWRDAVELLQECPGLLEINAHVRQKAC